MTDTFPARVGDVIEHGQPIPANVVRFRDSQDDRWRRLGTPQPLFTHMPDDDPVTYAPEELQARPRWWPMTVVEVDPESQPADTTCAQCSIRLAANGSDVCANCERDNALKPAAPGPVVLTLPVVPDGAVALIGKATGGRYVPYLLTASWVWPGAEQTTPVGEVLDEEGSVTVEFAPPREPRTWPKLDAVPKLDGLPDAVDLIEPGRSPLRFTRTTGLRGVHRYIEPGHPDISFTLTELRQLGEVREVLGD